MAADPTSVVVGLAAGFGSGMLASMVGIGGAVVTTPAIRFAGATPLAAIGSTVPAILPGALSGTYRYQRAGLVDRRVAFVCGGAGVVSAVIGGVVTDFVDARWLMVVTAFLVLWSATVLIRSSRPRRPDPDRSVPDGADEPEVVAPAAASAAGPPPTALLIALGTGAGFLAGLLGVGGGIVLTPGLTLLGHMPVKRAIASSLAAVALLSVASLATHIRLGHVDWGYAIPLVIGVVPGARLGAHITVGSSEETVRRTAGIALGVIAVIYLARELGALLG